MSEKFTVEFLKELQDLPLDRKILLTQNRIIEYYDVMKGKVFVAFSGGKDSTVLLHIARQVFSDIKAVFCNTGLEYPEVVEFVKTTNDVEIIRPEKSFKSIVDEHGFTFPSKQTSGLLACYQKGDKWARDIIDNLEEYLKGKPNADKLRVNLSRYEKYYPLLHAPFKVSDKCCYYNKKKPFKDYEKATGYHPIVGTMAEESNRRLYAWQMTGCNSFKKGSEISKPMSFWKESDVIAYIDKYKIPYCSLYGDIKNGKFTGIDRTGCVFCMVGIHLHKENQFKRLKQTHPKLWNYCIKPKSEGGLGIGEAIDWINENLSVGYAGKGGIDYGQNDLDLWS